MKESSNLLATVLELKTQRTGVYNSSISGQYLSNCTGARFSKVPVTSGPDNLSGPLSGNFIGPDIAFLEAPVNFPGNYRAR